MAGQRQRGQERPGRPKTDKLDAVWLAKLNERGMRRPSFVPRIEIRRLRDYTRLRLELAQDRARYYGRLEKLLEDALIKVSAVASRMTTLSVRDMIEALISGEPGSKDAFEANAWRRSAPARSDTRRCCRRTVIIDIGRKSVACSAMSMVLHSPIKSCGMVIISI